MSCPNCTGNCSNCGTPKLYVDCCTVMNCIDIKSSDNSVTIAKDDCGVDITQTGNNLDTIFKLNNDDCISYTKEFIDGVLTYTASFDPDCAVAMSSDYCADFTTDSDQKNTATVTDYDFLALDTQDPCNTFKISPPTGFAVTGDTRVSAFGKMEWFDTLALANTSAVAGETVLLFNDTVENLTLKDNVNYFGIGQHSIGNLSSTSSGNSINIISNLTITDISATGNSYIITKGVKVVGNSVISGSTVWEGGSFLDINIGTVITLTSSGVLTKAYIKIRVNINRNAKLTDSTIKDVTTAASTFPIIMANGTLANESASVLNCDISSTNNGGLYAVANQGVGNYIISGNTIRTNIDVALFVHTGDLTDASGIIVSHNTISNVGEDTGSVVATGCAMIVYGTVLPNDDRQDNAQNPIISHNTVHSIDGVGIKSVLGSFKNCSAYSENNYGIFIDSQENLGFDIPIVDCYAESKNSHALRATRDIYIIGGTFVSKWDNASGSPILIDDNRQNGTINNYYIAGAKTLAYNASAYGIDAPGAVTARISGCNFLNENAPTAAPGINTGLITLSAVAIDAYGNMN